MKKVRLGWTSNHLFGSNDHESFNEITYRARYKVEQLSVLVMIWIVWDYSNPQSLKRSAQYISHLLL